MTQTEMVVHGNGQQENVSQFVRRTMFKGVPADELALTMLMAERYDLDPVAKQIVVIRFSGKFQPYITRDGLLHVAHRSGQFDGMTCTYSKDDIGEYAEATVHRKDMSHPFVYRAYRQEYDTGKFTWKSHPIAMTTKTAEVIALRRAFDVSMTAADEMDVAVQVQNGEVIEAEAQNVNTTTGEISPNARPLSAEETRKVYDKAKAMSLEMSDVLAALDVETIDKYREVAPYIAALEAMDAYIDAQLADAKPATPKSENGAEADTPSEQPALIEDDTPTDPVTNYSEGS